MDIQPNNSSTPQLQLQVQGYSMMPGLDNQHNGLYVPEIGLEENVLFTIEGNKNNIKINGVLYISDQQYWLKVIQNYQNINQQDSKLISVEYRSTQTIGTNGNTLIIFINSQKNQHDSAEQQQQQQLSKSDQLIELVKKQKKGNFCLQGQCTLIIQFNNKQTMQKGYNLLSLYVGEEDQGNSQYDQDDNMEEMISADNIDQYGNIVLNKQEEQQGEQDHQQQEEDNMMEQQNQQNK